MCRFGSWVEADSTGTEFNRIIRSGALGEAQAIGVAKAIQLMISPLFLASFSCHSRRSVFVSLAHPVTSPIILKGASER